MKKFLLCLVSISLALTLCACNTEDTKVDDKDTAKETTTAQQKDVADVKNVDGTSAPENEYKTSYKFHLGRDLSTQKDLKNNDTLGKWTMTQLVLGENNKPDEPWVNAKFKGFVEVEGYISVFNNEMIDRSPDLLFQVESVDKIPVCYDNSSEEYKDLLIDAEIKNDPETIRKQLNIKDGDDTFRVKVKAVVTEWNVVRKPMYCWDTVEFKSVEEIK